MFPLLRLPVLAQYEVVKNMEVFESLLLIQCSRRANKLVQSQRIPIELEVNYSILASILKFRKHKTSEEFIEMEIRNRLLFTHGTWRISDQVVPVRIYTKSLYASWQNELAGLKLFLEFLTNSFNVKIASFYMSTDDAVEVLEHSKMLALNFGTISLNMGRCNANLAKTLFDISANAKKLEFVAETPRAFHYENFNEFSMNTLTIYYALHVTVNDITSLNGVRDLTLMGVKFSSLEFNQILNMWLSGMINFRKIYLFNETRSIELDAVLDGLNAVGQPDKSYEVQRGDGIIGNLEIYERGVHLIVQN